MNLEDIKNIRIVILKRKEDNSEFKISATINKNLDNEKTKNGVMSADLLIGAIELNVSVVLLNDDGTDQKVVIEGSGDNQYLTTLPDENGKNLNDLPIYE